jgi:hypothetical protein
MPDLRPVVAIPALLLCLACLPTPADDPGESAPSDAAPSETDTAPAPEAPSTVPTSTVPTSTVPGTSTAPAEDVARSFPNASEALAGLAEPTAETFLFYLHGAVVEGSDGRPTHPTRGVYEYRDIVDAMTASGVVVISEVRPRDTEVEAYARGVVEQVEALIDAGVPEGRITVVGFSKGGNIAFHVSHFSERDQLGFVILAACGSWFDDTTLDLSGRMLSIHEESDGGITSCRPLVERAEPGPLFHEQMTTLGGGHGAFFVPQDAWLEPTLLWANAPKLREQVQPPQRIDG